MAKRHKPPGQQIDGREVRPETASRADLDPELVEQGVLGNAAMQARLSGASGGAVQGDPFGQTEVVAHARALVEQARVAVQSVPRAEAQVVRFVAIIEGSRLPAERKEDVVDRLVEDQALAVDAARVLETHLGPMDAAARSTWSHVFDRVLAGLDGTSPAGLGAAELAGQVAATEAVGLSTPSGDTARDVAELCRNIALLVHFEEDEEEAEAGGDYALEESGV